MLKEILDIGFPIFLGASNGYLLVDRWFLSKELMTFKNFTKSEVKTLCSNIKLLQDQHFMLLTACAKGCITRKKNEDGSVSINVECSHNFCGDSCQ